MEIRWTTCVLNLLRYNTTKWIIGKKIEKFSILALKGLFHVALVLHTREFGKTVATVAKVIAVSSAEVLPPSLINMCPPT